MQGDKIVIVGGYGAVGQIIAAHLSKRFPNKVIIAGRSKAKASSVAEQLQHGTSAMYLDVQQSESFAFSNDVKMVIMCLDISDTKLVSYCIDRGIQYMDITANFDVMQQIALLDSAAQQNQVGLYLSVGLAPGVSNLLASYVQRQLPHTNSLDIFILLGLGEAHGDKAFQWTFNNINSQYTIVQHPTKDELRSFTDRKTTTLLGNRDFYLFNFSDQHVLAQDATLQKVRTRLTFDINWLTRLVAWMRKWNLSAVYNNKWIQKVMTRLLQKAYIGSNVYGVKAIATSNTGQTVSALINGKEEGNITALVAYWVATEIYTQTEYLPKGVQHIHQIIKDVPAFLADLQQLDSTLEVSLPVPHVAS